MPIAPAPAVQQLVPAPKAAVTPNDAAAAVQAVQQFVAVAAVQAVQPTRTVGTTWRPMDMREWAMSVYPEPEYRSP